MKKHMVNYENNPFNIGLNAIRLVFKKAKNVAIFAVVLSALAFLSNASSNVNDFANTATLSPAEIKAQEKADEKAVSEFFAQDPGTIAVIGILGASALFLFIVISLWLYGTFDYTAARLAEGNKVGLKEALVGTGKELASYIWMYIIIFVKVLLWSLLFIIPGIIMAVRYSLAGTVFFAEGKRGNEAVKRSLELTRGAWFTTFASIGLWNIITIGAITYVLQPGVNAQLYRQYVPLTDANEPKPAAHWLSWATLLAPIAIIGFLGTMAVLIFVLITALQG